MIVLMLLIERTRKTEKKGRMFQMIPHTVQKMELEKITGFRELRNPSATGIVVERIEMSVQMIKM